MTGRHALRDVTMAPPGGMDSVADQLGARVRRGAAWSVGSALFLRLSSVLTTAIVAHIFNRSEFGVFTIALTANTIVTIVGQFGLTSCLTRADLDMDSMAPTMLTFSVVTNLIQAGAMFAFARPIAMALGSTAAAGPVKILAIAQIIVGFAEIPNCQLAREFSQRKLFLAQVVGSVPSTAVLLILALSGAGPVAYAWSMDFGIFLSACVVFASAGRYYRPGLRRSALGVLFRYGFPLGMANIVNVVLLNVDYALIGHLVGPEALGSYVLAFNVASWPASLLGTMLNWVGIPAFSRVKDNQQVLDKAVVAALRAFSLVVLPMSTLTMVLSRPLVMVLYGSKWTMSASVLQVLAIYGAASVMCTLFANILAGLGRSKVLVVVQLTWLGLLLPAMTIGVMMHGIYGAAVAHVVVVALVMPCYMVAVKRVTGVRLAWLFRAILPALAASSVAGFAAEVVASQFPGPPVQLATGMTTGVLIYTLAVSPQIVALVSRVGSGRAPVVRVLRAYNRAARLVGLAGCRPAKHTRRGGSSRGRAAVASAFPSPREPVPGSATPRRLRVRPAPGGTGLVRTGKQAPWSRRHRAHRDRAPTGHRRSARAGGLQLGEHVTVELSWPGVVAPSGDDVGDVGMRVPKMNDSPTEPVSASVSTSASRRHRGQQAGPGSARAAQAAEMCRRLESRANADGRHSTQSGRTAD